MRLFAFCACVLGCLSFAVSESWGALSLSMEVMPAYAPQGPVSPSWDSYVSNSIVGIEGGGVNVGDRTLSPAAYELVDGMVSPLELFYTDYPSWRGSADPTNTFMGLPAGFQSELGNRVHFGLHITSPGKEFALNDLEWSLDSNDDDNYWDQAGTFAGASYNSARVGIHYGADGIKGTADDTTYNSGEAGTTEVNEFIYTGVGEGFNAHQVGLADDQEEIDVLLRSIMLGIKGKKVELTGTYRLNDPDYPSPAIASSTILVGADPGFGGDLSRDGVIDCRDLDILTDKVAGHSHDILYDVNGDHEVNFDDIQYMVDEVKHTYFGDANCDGEFNSADLVDLFQTAKYETTAWAVWSEGDFNGDGAFDSSDLVLAFQDGGYEQGPRWVGNEHPTGYNGSIQINAVPEPGSLILLLGGCLAVIGRFRRVR